MKRNKVWIPALLMGVSLVVCIMALIQSINSTPQRYPLLGLIPCVIGAASFLYINKTAQKKTLFLWFTQILNIVFMIFPLITLLYFMSSN
ncbi:hypothetical protein A8L44_02785 [Bacillus sp. FJAT-27986]|nr:hypothetical protein A8L44_02785 [Bacillus sp. FJAT-27986]